MTYRYLFIGMLCFALAFMPVCAGAETATTPETATVERPFLYAFETTDLEGNTVGPEIFADHDLTMVNIWATYCRPCLSEMPDLGKLSEAYADQGVQIIGLVSDALNMDGTISESQVEFAKEIAETTGAGYRHLLPSQDLIHIVLWQVQAVPTTFFVDSKGSLVGYVYEGAHDYETWDTIIKETLALL